MADFGGQIPGLAAGNVALTCVIKPHQTKRSADTSTREDHLYDVLTLLPILTSQLCASRGPLAKAAGGIALLGQRIDRKKLSIMATETGVRPSPPLGLLTSRLQTRVKISSGQRGPRRPRSSARAGCSPSLSAAILGRRRPRSWTGSSPRIAVIILALCHAGTFGAHVPGRPGGTARFPHFAFGERRAGIGFGFFAYMQAVTIAPIECFAFIQYASYYWPNLFDANKGNVTGFGLRRRPSC